MPLRGVFRVPVRHRKDPNPNPNSNPRIFAMEGSPIFRGCPSSSPHPQPPNPLLPEHCLISHLTLSYKPKVDTRTGTNHLSQFLMMLTMCSLRQAVTATQSRLLLCTLNALLCRCVVDFRHDNDYEQQQQLTLSNYIYCYELSPTTRSRAVAGMADCTIYAKAVAH